LNIKLEVHFSTLNPGSPFILGSNSQSLKGQGHNVCDGLQTERNIAAATYGVGFSLLRVPASFSYSDATIGEMNSYKWSKAGMTSLLMLDEDNNREA